MTRTRLNRIAAAALIVATLLAGATTTNAAALRHHHSHWRHFHARHMYRHMSITPEKMYGAYPNATIFKSGGHVYRKDLDTGYTYVIR